MGINKLEFDIRMYTRADHMCPTRVAAASAQQALMLAMSDPHNERYDKFGLVGEDNNCHTWQFRPGTPRKRPRGFGTFASSIQDARGRTPVVVTKQEAPPPPKGPIIVSSKELADIVMKHVLPQLSPKRPFRTDEIARLLPVQYASAWTRSQNVRSFVLVKLREAGVITKYSHFEYLRAPEFVDKKLVVEEPQRTVNGNGHAPEASPALAAAPPAAPVAAPTPPPPPPETRAAQPVQPALSPEQKVDAVLLTICAVMNDRSQYKAEVDALSEELINVMTQMDAIRAKLEALIKREQQAPMHFGELLNSLRRPASHAPPPSSAQPAAVVLSS